MRFVLAFAILVVLHQTWADDYSQDEEYDIDIDIEDIEDMVILEAAPRVTRETEIKEDSEEGVREGKQFFFGVGPQFPGGFIMQRWGLGFPAATNPGWPAIVPFQRVQAPVQAPVQVPIQVPVQVPIQAPIQAPVQVPVQVPIQAPVPVQVPIQAPVQVQVPVQVPVLEAPVQAGCKTSEGKEGECVALNKCYSLFEALPKDLPSWALGTKESCIVQNAQPDRMGYYSTYGVCCTTSSGQNQQSSLTKPPKQTQIPTRRQWGGQYPAGTFPIYPGGGFPQQGGFGGPPPGLGGFGGGPPGGGFGGGQFGGRPQGPPPGIGGPPGGGQFGGAGGPPPGFGQPQGPPPGFGGGQPQGPPPGFGGGQPQGPPPGPPQGPPQRPPPQRPTQPPPQKVDVAKPEPEEVKEIISSNDDGDYTRCGVGRNPVTYNEDGEEVEQADRASGKAHPLRVAGGWPADRNEWPWIVMMLNRGNQFCDGSIIDEYHILTAAHCVAQMRASDVSTLTVRAGAHNLKNSANEAGIQNVGVKLVVKHKDFTMQTLHSDIAILVLKSPIKYTSTVRRVCLPSTDDTYEGKMGTVAGWGLLKEGGSRPTVLMELTMKIWNNDKCRTTYGSTAPAGIKSSMLCAGKQGKDSCSGDSGGPFVAPVGDHWEQIGVVSWGIGCGKQHYPGVYTRVSEMMDWIDKVRKLYPN